VSNIETEIFGRIRSLANAELDTAAFCVAASQDPYAMSDSTDSDGIYAEVSKLLDGFGYKLVPSYAGNGAPTSIAGK
jgi:hypothetical protein